MATAANAGPERDLGATVRANLAAQVIDPDPDYSGVPLPGTSGRRAADAMIRYQTGKSEAAAEDQWQGGHLRPGRIGRRTDGLDSADLERQRSELMAPALLSGWGR